MTVIRIPWQIGNTITAWNEVCAWSIEQFGLPGDRFTTHPTEDYMDFKFLDEQDAVFFALRWAGASLQNA